MLLQDHLSELIKEITAKGNGNGGSSNNGGYYFYDLNGKINHKISDKHRLYFSHYMGRDKAFLDAIDNYNYDTVVGVDTINSQLGWGTLSVHFDGTICHQTKCLSTPPYDTNMTF